MQGFLCTKISQNGKKLNRNMACWQDFSKNFPLLTGMDDARSTSAQIVPMLLPGAKAPDIRTAADKPLTRSASWHTMKEIIRLSGKGTLLCKKKA